MDSAPPPYFCYKCNKYLHPEHVVDYKCRFCNTGFIEEIQPGVNNLTEDDSRSNSPGQSVDMGQLLGMIIGGGSSGNSPAGRQPVIFHNGRPQRGNQAAGNNSDGFLGGVFRTLINNQPPAGPNPPNNSSPGRQRAGSDEPQVHAAESDGTQIHIGNIDNVLQQLLQNLMPNNSQIRIQFGGNNFSLGDFATDGNFDEIVTQILNQFDGSGPVQRVSEEDLQHLPRIKVSQQQVDNEVQCTTCMDQFVLNEEVAELDCHHIFHPDCIIPWLRNHNTCPICRQTVNAENWNGNPANPVPPPAPEGFQDHDELD